MKSLQDKVVVITGAGSGMGREMALLAARSGARVAISDWNADSVAETALMAKEFGDDIRSDVVDVRDRDQMSAWASAVVDQFGTVNVMVNNAGVTMTGNFLNMTVEEFDWIVGINFDGVVSGTRAFLPHLIASGDGHLINISSLFGLIAVPQQAAYNATKFAVRGFTEALREEMLIAKHPVTVTCVHPGGIKTGITRNGRKAEGTDSAALNALFDTLATMPADKAARIILNAGMKGKARALVGMDAHVIHQLAKVAGSGYQDVVAAVAGRLMRRTRV